MLEVVSFLLLLVLSWCLGLLSRRKRLGGAQEKMYMLMLSAVAGGALNFAEVELEHLSSERTLEWCYYTIVPILLLEKVVNSNRNILYLTLGNTAMLTVIGGIIYLAIGSIVMYYSSYLGLAESLEAREALALSVVFYASEGGLPGINKEYLKYFELQSQSLSCWFLVLPLLKSLSYLDTSEPASVLEVLWGFTVNLVVSVIVGVSIGLLGSISLRFAMNPRIWDPFEPASTVLITFFSFCFCELFDLSGPVSLISTGLILLKYYFMCDLSRIILTNSLTSYGGIAELFAYGLLGLFFAQSLAQATTGVIWSSIALLSTLLSLCFLQLLLLLLGRPRVPYSTLLGLTLLPQKGPLCLLLLPLTQPSPELFHSGVCALIVFVTVI